MSSRNLFQTLMIGTTIFVSTAAFGFIFQRFGDGTYSYRVSPAQPTCEDNMVLFQDCFRRPQCAQLGGPENDGENFKACGGRGCFVKTSETCPKPEPLEEKRVHGGGPIDTTGYVP